MNIICRIFGHKMMYEQPAKIKKTFKLKTRCDRCEEDGPFFIIEKHKVRK